jgi:uncharacterized metal-binding protein
MTEKAKCACGDAPKLIFPCSGGSDVGELTDQTARKLTKDGIGKMYCLAGIGGRVSGIIASTESAAKILAIDGCPLDCARKTLEQAGFSKFEHLSLPALGLNKGNSPATDENITRVAQKAASLLAC